jgi:hypothetical protein
VFRRLAATVMLASLIAATVLSFIWVLVSGNADLLESSAQTLGLVGALTAIVAERIAAERQTRLQAMAGLVDELHKNEEIIADLRVTLGQLARRRVYPRLLISATDGMITSGVLTTAGDRELTAKLHLWRNEVADFNRRLDLTEMMTFLQGTPEVIRGFEQALGSDNGRLRQVEVLLRELLNSITPPARQPAAELRTVPPIPVPTPPGDERKPRERQTAGR